MKTFSLLFLVFYSLFFVCPTFAADLPGAKDPLGIQRYEGSEIVRYEQIKYDEYEVPLGKMTKFDFNLKTAQYEKSKKLEGGVTRITYRVADKERSSLEVYRNYESTLAEAGWQILFRASGKGEYGTAFTHTYESLKDNDQLLTYSDSQGHLLVAEKQNEGQTLVLFVTKFQDGLSRGVKVNKGDPLIQLDLIETKKMDQKMVVVPSSEMATSLEKSGKVSLYGIYFDFNKYELKAESEPTLQQITKLLTEKPTMKLLIVGHTDNVGGFEANRQLSQQRAAAVVSELSTKYKINESRLIPFGASFAAPVSSNENEEGRAKNRRVELVTVQ